MSDRLADAAFAAAQRADYATAAALFEQAARAQLAAGARDAAFTAFSNVTMMRKLGGDLRGALAAADEGLALGTASPQRVLLVMTRASVLDLLDDWRAMLGWVEAAKAAPNTPQSTFCTAHAVGGQIKHAQPNAVENARALIGRSQQLPAPMLVGLIGAIGESAGSRGVAFLAQAVLAMMRKPDAFTASTAPYWELLIDRIGRDTPLALGLIGIGLALASLRKGQPDHEALMSRIRTVLDRCANARGITVDAMLGQLQGNRSALDVAPPLRALVPVDHWVVQEKT